jgi:hypothetical protein
VFSLGGADSVVVFRDMLERFGFDPRTGIERCELSVGGGDGLTLAFRAGMKEVIRHVLAFAGHSIFQQQVTVNSQPK